MSNGLVPFEEKIESWQVTHPRRWVATADRADAVNFLSNQTKKVVKAQLEAADRIIVSQDRIADKIDIATRDVTEGLEELRATFEWGFTELIWQIEQERKVLKDILEVLQAPLDTQAKELRKRAEYAYRNGWINDALADFLESEKKNRYDFTIHQSLGNVYLFEKKDPNKALEYYEKAVKYATPKSSYYASISLLHLGLVRYLRGDFERAHEATLKAIELSPNLYEAHYQHAQYCAKLGSGHYKEAIQHLRRAIVNGSKHYCVKADSEKDFDVMKKELRSLFKKLRNEAQSQAKLRIDKAEKLIHSAKSYGVGVSELSAAEKELKETKIFSKRESLFDCWDAFYKAYTAEKITAESSVRYLFNEIERLKSKRRELKQEINNKAELVAWVVGFLYLILTILFTGLSDLSAGAKTGLIFLFILTSIAVGVIVERVVNHLSRSHHIPPLNERKKQLETRCLKIKDKSDQLRREGDKIVPRGFRPEDHTKKKTRRKLVEEMTEEEYQRKDGKRPEEMTNEELRRSFEEEPARLGPKVCPYCSILYYGRPACCSNCGQELEVKQ